MDLNEKLEVAGFLNSDVQRWGDTVLEQAEPLVADCCEPGMTVEECDESVLVMVMECCADCKVPASILSDVVNYVIGRVS